MEKRDMFLLSRTWVLLGRNKQVKIKLWRNIRE